MVFLMPKKNKFKKLNDEQKMQNQAGGLTFSVILGIIGIFQTISMLIPMFVNWFKPAAVEPEIIENPYKQNLNNQETKQKPPLNNAYRNFNRDSDLGINGAQTIILS